MTDNESIKALEEHIEHTKNIKYGARKMAMVDVELLKNTLDFIKRLHAEIEAHKHYYNECLKDLKNAHAEIERLEKCYALAVAEREANVKGFTEEIEKLTALNGVNETCSARKQETIERLEVELKAMRGAANGYKAEVEKLHPYKLHYGNLRMEIAREFADRLKDKKVYSTERHENIVPVAVIDWTVKEMENECEGKQA